MLNEQGQPSTERNNAASHPEALFTRVRHPLKFRLVQVKAVNHLSAGLLSVTLAGEDLQGFTSSAFDDHVKVFFPLPGEEKPALPSVGAEGPVFPEGLPKPAARDFTPRRFDPVAGELDLEFALHAEDSAHYGPAASWAAQAQVGQYLGIGGPRGSRVLNQSFDWWLLIGDETALPAIGRRLEELPAGSQVTVLLEVENAAAEIALPAKAGVKLSWHYRAAGAEALQTALKQWQPPQGLGFVWAAGEYASMQAVREILLQQHALDKRYLRVASYWKRGAQNAHEQLEG